MSLYLPIDCYKSLPVICGVTLRKGGVSLGGYTSLNMGFNSGDEKEKVIENRERLYNELNASSSSFIYANQVHGDNVEVILSDYMGRGALSSSDAIDNIDGMVTNKKGIFLTIQTADCMSIFVYCRKSKSIGLLHAGWKGTKLNIVKKGIDLMQEKFGAKPDDMICYLGPAISVNNYKVGDEFCSYFDKEFLNKTKDGLFLDIKKANCANLINLGVNEIYSYSGCTYSEDDKFFSYRRSGANTGRMLSFICLK